MMPTATLTWSGTVTARSSIAHGGQTRGTITLLRRESVIQPDGNVVYVPVISGNAFRGRLRRTGEEMLRDVLQYEGRLSRSAAAALRGGGALARTSGEPLSGRRLQALRRLVPHVGVFGCVGAGTVIDGALKVGKVHPQVRETAHITGISTQGLSAFEVTQLEMYVRGDDTDSRVLDPVGTRPVPVAADGQPIVDGDPDSHPDSEPDCDASGDLVPFLERRDSSQMVYSIETFPAGTRFSTWLRLDRATDLEIAFFTDVLDTFLTHGWLGGRSAIGHGQIAADLARRTIAGEPSDPLPDWRTDILLHRDQALEALAGLT